MMFSFLVDTNLIQLDTDDMATNSNTYADNDDDLIFEVGNSTQGKYLDENRSYFLPRFSAKYLPLSFTPRWIGRHTRFIFSRNFFARILPG